MTKVSFDFDGTLDREDVQGYAKSLIDLGIEVWICTARFSEHEYYSKRWNDDLYKVSDKIGIKRSNIKFCSMSDKYLFFEDKDFIFHLDDDMTEIKMINEYTKTKGVNLFGNSEWMAECQMQLNKFKNESDKG